MLTKVMIEKAKTHDFYNQGPLDFQVSNQSYYTFGSVGVSITKINAKGETARKTVCGWKNMTCTDVIRAFSNAVWEED